MAGSACENSRAMSKGPENRSQQSWTLAGGTVLTMDPEARVLEANVVVESGRITAIEKDRRHSSAGTDNRPGQRLDVSGCLVLPGLIQGHIHLGQTLFRGLAEGRRLLPWLEERIWPLEAAHDDESAYWSGMLGAAECLLSGSTTIQDIGIGPGSRGLLEAIRDSGLRAFAGHCLMDEVESMAPGLASSTDQELRQTEDLGSEMDGAANGRLRYAINPRFILSCSDALWKELHDFSRRTGWPIHTHALEQREEGAVIRELKGCDEIEYFERHGLLDSDLRIAHGVQLDQSHLERLSGLPPDGGSFSVTHCPTSNLKLGSGIADVVALRRSGIPVGIGADGSPCNNDLCVIEEMRLAALLQKLRHGPESFSGLDALRLATSEGARALGMEREIGSIEVGKRADLLVLETDRPEQWPADWAASAAESRLGASLADQVVFTGSRAGVRHVLVDGELLVENGRLVRLDLAEIKRKAYDQLTELLQRARVR